MTCNGCMDDMLAEQRVYQSISDALRDGKNVGIMGMTDAETGETNRSQWRMLGDCVELMDSNEWHILPAMAVNHPFSLGVYAIHSNTVYHWAAADAIYQEVFGS